MIFAIGAAVLARRCGYTAGARVALLVILLSIVEIAVRVGGATSFNRTVVDVVGGGLAGLAVVVPGWFALREARIHREGTREREVIDLLGFVAWLSAGWLILMVGGSALVGAFVAVSIGMAIMLPPAVPTATAKVLEPERG